MCLSIGDVIVKKRLLAAPMAGFSDISWRELVSSFGPGIVYSEMVSAEGIKRRQAKTLRYLRNREEARPFAVQLFGCNPDSFIEACRVLTDFRFDLIDINAGCPVKKVIKGGAGAALMKEPLKIGRILDAVRSVYLGPLTIKIRSGWDRNNINAIEVAKLAENSGVDGIAIHPRTKEQQFRGLADWNLIKDVKDRLSVPVVGNGDILSTNDIDQMFQQTGCDAVMIGRAALSKPWLFEKRDNADLSEIIAIIRRHIDILLGDHGSEKYIVNMMKKFIPKYLKGCRHSKTLIREIYKLTSIEEVLESINLFEHLSDRGD